MVQMHLLPLFGGMFQFHRTPDLASAGWLVCLFGAYAVFLLVANGMVPTTARHARLTCAIIHVCVLLCLIFSGAEDKDGYVVRRDFLMRCEVILAIVFPDRTLLFPFAALFLLAYIGTTAMSCGHDGLGLWFWEQQAFQVFITCVVVPMVTENIHRDRIAAYVNAQNSDSLVCRNSTLRQIPHCSLEGSTT